MVVNVSGENIKKKKLIKTFIIKQFYSKQLDLIQLVKTVN